MVKTFTALGAKKKAHTRQHKRKLYTPPPKNFVDLSQIPSDVESPEHECLMHTQHVQRERIASREKRVCAALDADKDTEEELTTAQPIPIAQMVHLPACTTTMVNCIHHQINRQRFTDNEDLILAREHIVHVKRLVHYLDVTRATVWISRHSDQHDERIMLRREIKFQLHDLYESLDSLFKLTARDVHCYTIPAACDSTAS